MVKRAIRNVDGILHAVAKSEMPGQFETNWAEVEYRRPEISFTRISGLARTLDGGDNWASVKVGYFELFHGKVNAYPMPLVATDEVS